MEALKSIIISSCVLGIISAVTEMICPSEKFEGELKVITGAIFIIIFTAGLMKIDPEELASVSSASEDFSHAVSASADDYCKQAMENTLAITLKNRLAEEGIAAEKIIACIDISESGGIYINEVTVWLTDFSDRYAAEEILRSATAEDTAICAKNAKELQDG